MWANRNSWQKLYDGEVITCRLLPYCRRWEWSAGLVYRSNCMTQFREWETNMGGQIPAGFNTSWVLLCMKSWDSQPFDKFLKKSVYDGETLSCFLACHFQVCPCLDVHWYLPFCLHIGLLLFVLCFSGQAFVSLCLSYIFLLHWFLCTAFPSVVCFLSVWLTHFSLTCPSLSRLRLCLFIPQTSACNSVYRHTYSIWCCPTWGILQDEAKSLLEGSAGEFKGPHTQTWNTNSYQFHLHFQEQSLSLMSTVIKHQ